MGTGSGIFGAGHAVANGAFGGFVGGLIAGRGDLKAALQGAITGAVFGQIGDWAKAGGWSNLARVSAEAASHRRLEEDSAEVVH